MTRYWNPTGRGRHLFGELAELAVDLILVSRSLAVGPLGYIGHSRDHWHAVAMAQEEFITGVWCWALGDAAGESALRPAGHKRHQVLVTVWDRYAAPV